MALAIGQRAVYGGWGMSGAIAVVAIAGGIGVTGGVIVSAFLVGAALGLISPRR